jgi:hypothetical protein
MKLPLILGLAGGRDPGEALVPGIEEAVARLAADLSARFPGAPWIVSTARANELERRAARACEEAGLRVVTCAPGSGASRLAEDGHLFVTLGLDATLDLLASARLSSTATGFATGKLDPPTQGPVVRIRAAEGGWTAAWENPETGASSARKGSSRKGPPYEKIWRRVEAFNADARALDPAAGTPLLPEEERRTLPADLIALDESYRVADALARHFQERSQRALGALLVLAILATFLLQAGTFAGARKVVSGILYVASLTGAWSVFLIAKKRDLRTKYLDYRALAEGLRVQFFWRLAALPASAADHYLRKQRSELDWIRHALRAIEILNPPVREPSRLPAAREHWLESEARYFAAAAKDHDAKDRCVRRISAALFVVALALAFLKPFLDSAHPLVVLVGLCPLTAAFVKWWSERRAFGPLAHQYERMAILFDAATREAGRALEAGRLEDARGVLLEAGREALAENGDWVLLHRERPVRVPGT